METQVTHLPNRRERKKENTKLKIVNVAMKLFQEQGFGATSMEQIAEQVDIAKGTLYNYFPVKEAIICEFIQEFISSHTDNVKQIIHDFPDTRSRLIAFFKASLRWALEHRDIVLVYFSYSTQRILHALTDNSERSGTEKMIAQILLAGQRSGEIRKDIGVERMADSIYVIYGFTAMSLLLKPKTTSHNSYIFKMVDLFLNGAAVDRGRRK
jgi:AcrR family transcriptional regulator